MASLSLVLGVLAFSRYRDSETYIKAALGDFERIGKSLSTEQCVDRVLDWHKNCEAMSGLCQAAVARLMRVCLRGQDRKAYCMGLGRSTTDTRFGYQECKARGLKRHRKKACGGLYRTIDAHCHAIGALSLPPQVERALAKRRAEGAASDVAKKASSGKGTTSPPSRPQPEDN